MKLIRIFLTTLGMFLFFFVVEAGAVSMMFPGPKNLENFINAPYVKGVAIAINVIAVAVFFATAVHSQLESRGYEKLFCAD